MTFNHPLAKPAIFAALLCSALFVTSLLCRPLFPVDETRYVTVAWEMFSTGDWLVPHLNGEAYHHKPPILFWLINIIWHLFGVSQSAAMAIPYLAGCAAIILTARLATRLLPDHPNAPFLAALIYGGSLPFVVYTNLLMFDTLLTVCVLVGITAIWDFLKTRHNKHLLGLILAIGLGALVKGPVILLHLLPVILLAALWLPKSDRPPLKTTCAKISASVLAGAAIALCWAIPAAIEGGKDFAEKIFWGQTAGRMVKAFDHEHPFYWYLTYIPAFFMPWIFAPSFWRGLVPLVRERVQVTKFLAAWAAPVFLAFCAISGKQVHYLLPLLPAIAILITTILIRTGQNITKGDMIGLATGSSILILLPDLIHLFTEILEDVSPESAHLDETLDNTNPYIAIVTTLVLLATAFLWSKQSTIKTIIVTAAFMGAMMCSAQFSVRDSFFKNYDIVPVAETLKPLENRPMAFAGNYAGEFGFLAKRTKPIQEIKREEARSWLEQNPTGVVVLFDRAAARPHYNQFNVLHEQPFRMTNLYMVIENKPKDPQGAAADN